MGKAVPTRGSLLARLKNLDDDQSWMDFFDTYHRLIYGAVIRRGLSHQDAEDIVAEIVEGVARRIPDFIYDPHRCRFKTWLFRIVGYRVADHFRRRARSLVCDAKDIADHFGEVPDPATMEPDEKWEEAWKNNLMQTAFERVRRRANPRYLQIYFYTEIEGHSVTEAAQHLQTTVNDVSVARHRIRAMLIEEGDRLIKEEKNRQQGIRRIAQTE